MAIPCNVNRFAQSATVSTSYHAKCDSEKCDNCTNLSASQAGGFLSAYTILSSSLRHHSSAANPTLLSMLMSWVTGNRS